MGSGDGVGDYTGTVTKDDTTGGSSGWVALFYEGSAMELIDRCKS